jgi:hypothetical protein
MLTRMIAAVRRNQRFDERAVGVLILFILFILIFGRELISGGFPY